MTGLQIVDVPSEVSVEATDEQLIIRLGRERDPAHSLFHACWLALLVASVFFAAVLIKVDADFILAGLVTAFVGILRFGRGPRVEVIRLDRDALVHQRRVGSIRRMRSYNTHV